MKSGGYYYLMRFLIGLALACAIANGQGVVTTIAGTDFIFPHGPLPALSAPLGYPTGLAADAAGNIYIADGFNCNVTKVDRTGTLTVVAGNGICAYDLDNGTPLLYGEGSAATGIPLPYINSIALDAAGNLYIGLFGYIRKVDSNGIITTIAGSGYIQPNSGGGIGPGFSGDGGPALKAHFGQPGQMIVDRSGSIYFTDVLNHRVRKISAGIISTIAGSGPTGYNLAPDASGDGALATSAVLRFPTGLALAGDGTLYIGDLGNNRVRKVNPSGGISTVANNPAPSLAINSQGTLFIDNLSQVFRLDPSGPQMVASKGGNAIVFDGSDNLYAGEVNSPLVYKIPSGGTPTLFAGNSGFRHSGEGVPALTSALNDPNYLTLDNSGNLVFTELVGNRVRKIANGVITTVAGNGIRLNTGDNIPAAQASIADPEGVAADAIGNLYIATGAIRKVSPAGTISTLAPQTTDTAYGLYGNLAADAAGNVFVLQSKVINFTADPSNASVVKIDTTGRVTPFAGNGVPGLSGDGGPATQAMFSVPSGLAVDPAGNVFVSDTGNSRIRKVTGGIISTFAKVDNPLALTLNPSGNLYASSSRTLIQRITPDSTVTLIGGGGSYIGDGHLGTDTALSSIGAVAADAQGTVYFTERGQTVQYAALDANFPSGGNRIRAILAKPPAYQISPNTLQFSGQSGGAPTPVQIVTVSSAVTGLEFNVSIDTKGTGNWLQATPSSGGMPRVLEISADPLTLSAGSYQATLTINAPNAATQSSSIAVSFNVAAGAPAKLAVDQPSLSFTFPNGAAARSATLMVSNSGSGSLAFTASATANAGGTWLAVAPAQGIALPGKPASLNVTADPTGLKPGAYTGTISLTGANGDRIAIPVTITVSANSKAILLSQTGLTFTAVVQGGVLPPQSFAVLNPGTGIVTWKTSTSTLPPGLSWLSATPSSGSTNAAQAAPIVTVTVNPAGLAAGVYYGQVRVDSTDAANSPQVVTVFLEVLPAGSDPGAIITPSEIVTNAVAGPNLPPTQELLVYGIGGSAKSFTLTATNIPGRDPFIAPAHGTVAPNQPTRVLLQYNSELTAPGTYPQTLNLQFSDGRVRTVKSTLIVSPTAASHARNPSEKGARIAAGQCVPSQLVPSLTTLGQSFTVSAGWPVALGVQVVDDCGAALNQGSVAVSFSNGDPPLSLKSLGNGTWQATWQAGNHSGTAVTLHIQAMNPQSQISGVKDVTGGFGSDKDPPVFDRAAVVSAAALTSYQAIAPGAFLSIFGTRLADNVATADKTPLPPQLGNASVIIAGQIAPLQFVSPGQINALAPVGLTPNTIQQVIVQRGLTYSLPAPVDVAPAQPGTFMSGGFGIAVAYRSDGTAPFLVSPANPARAGDVLVVYCSGLGQTNPPAVDGQPAAGGPTNDPVTATIGGQSAPVAYAGLVAGFVGLYQVNLTVPGGVPTGDSVPLTLSVSGQTSPPALLSIH